MHLTPSMKIAIEDLQLDKLIILYPGEKAYPLTDRIDVVSLIQLADKSKIPEL